MRVVVGFHLKNFYDYNRTTVGPSIIMKGLVMKGTLKIISNPMILRINGSNPLFLIYEM